MVEVWGEHVMTGVVTRVDSSASHFLLLSLVSSFVLSLPGQAQILKSRAFLPSTCPLKFEEIERMKRRKNVQFTGYAAVRGSQTNELRHFMKCNLLNIVSYQYTQFLIQDTNLRWWILKPLIHLLRFAIHKNGKTTCPKVENEILNIVHVQCSLHLLKATGP